MHKALSLYFPDLFWISTLQENKQKIRTKHFNVICSSVCDAEGKNDDDFWSWPTWSSVMGVCNVRNFKVIHMTLGCSWIHIDHAVIETSDMSCVRHSVVRIHSSCLFPERLHGLFLGPSSCINDMLMESSPVTPAPIFNLDADRCLCVCPLS